MQLPIGHSGSIVHAVDVTARRLGRPQRAAVARAVRVTLSRQKCTAATVSVAIVDDDAISRLHRRYLGIEGPTDVLSFDLRDERTPAAVDGEIVVSGDTARREARRRRIPASTELLRYVIHGTLHLLGFRDDTPARVKDMHRREDEILRILERERPRGLSRSTRACRAVTARTRKRTDGP